MRYDQNWQPARTRRRGTRNTASIALVLVVGIIGGVIGERFVPDIADMPAALSGGRSAPVDGVAGQRVSFGLCHSGGGENCVVDGDTFWMAGEKIRISDIDTPETHPSRCPLEADLGGKATLRLQALLNAGPVTLTIAGRATDRYGRKLRVVERDGRSLGDVLVAEGLARRWTGRRLPWCEV